MLFKIFFTDSFFCEVREIQIFFICLLLSFIKSNSEIFCEAREIQIFFICLLLSFIKSNSENFVTKYSARVFFSSMFSSPYSIKKRNSSYSYASIGSICNSSYSYASMGSIFSSCFWITCFICFMGSKEISTPNKIFARDISISL